MLRRLSLTALAVALTASTASSQLQEGPVLGAPNAFGVDDATFSAPGVPVPADRLQRKRVGFVSSTTVGRTVGPEPDWDGLPFLNQAFVADAFSIGQDVVNATVPSGGVSTIAVPPGGWGAIAYSVTRDTTGTPGSVVAEQSLELDGPGADLFSHVLPTSTFAPSIAPCFPPTTSQLAQDSPSMGLFDGTNPGEMTYFDLYLPSYYAGSPARDLVPDEPRVFFSVRDVDVSGPGGSLVPPAWFDDGSSPSGATILVTRWVITGGGTSGFWTVPRVFLNYDELGLDVDDDLDALALSTAQCLALFSIVSKGAGLGEQLQVVAWPCGPVFSGTSTQVGEYRDPLNNAAARNMDLANDADIDGLCTIDPSGQDVGTCSPYYGWPVAKSAFNKKLSAQIWRDEAAPLPTATLVIDGVEPAFAGKTLAVYALIGGFAPIKIYEELLLPTTKPTRTLPFPSNVLGGGPPGPSVCIDFAPIIGPAPKVGGIVSSLRVF